MPSPRADAIRSIVDDLESFEIDNNAYYDDPEPRGFYDDHLNGKLRGLLAFCKTLGWTELAAHLQEMTPIQGDAITALETIQGYVIPEVRRLVTVADVDAKAEPTLWFWEFVHPRIAALARPRYEAGFFGDAVECSYKEVNDSMKRLVRELSGKELDGAGLMTTALSPTNPIVRLSTLETETDKNIQQGYMQIFAGSMTGIRNPKAHGNLNPDSGKALHLIALASLLMHKIDERVE
jgi:uncharacterized protein (TIGR02391 family)